MLTELAAALVAVQTPLVLVETQQFLSVVAFRTDVQIGSLPLVVTWHNPLRVLVSLQILLFGSLITKKTFPTALLLLTVPNRLKKRLRLQSELLASISFVFDRTAFLTRRIVT